MKILSQIQTIPSNIPFGLALLRAYCVKSEGGAYAESNVLVMPEFEDHEPLIDLFLLIMPQK